MGTRYRNLLVACTSIAVFGASALACDTPNARPAQVPVCCEEEQPEQWLPEDEPPPQKTVEYVKMDEWQPPPSVKALEERVPPRGDVPPSFTHFSKLTLDREIGGSRVRRFRRP